MPIVFPLSQEMRRHAAIPLVLCVLASAGGLALVGPHLPQLREVVLGLGGDPYQTLWRFSALAEAATRGTLDIPEDPFRNLGPLPWLLFHGLAGEPLGYNIVWILQFPLTALATYGLARFLRIAHGPAMLAGILAAFAPYRIAQSLGHFGAMQLFWIPLTIVALLFFLRRPSVPRLLLAAAAFVGTAWTEHVLFLTTLLATALTIVAFRDRVTSALRTPVGRWHAVTLLALVGLLGIFPFREELRRVSQTDSSFNPGTEQRLRFSPTPHTLFAPSAFHLARQNPQAYGTPRDAVADRVHTLGLLAPIMGMVGFGTLWRNGRRPQAVLLGSLAAAGLLLALAPRIPLGQQVANALPVISAVRTMNRFLALPVLAVPLLASVGLARLSSVPRGLVAGILLFEILPAPFPAQEAIVQPFYATLAETQGRAVLEIPAATDYLVASRAQYASAIHRRSVLGSNAFERVQSREERDAVLRTPVLGALLAVRPELLKRPTLFGQPPVEIARALLTSEGVTAVVVHERVLGFPTLRFGPERPVAATREDFDAVHRFLRTAGLQQEDINEDVTLYRVPPWTDAASAIVGIPRAGWTRLPDQPGGAQRARLDSRATFSVRILGTRPAPVTISFRILEPGGRRVHLHGAEAPQSSTASPNGTVSLFVGTLTPGAHEFSLTVDGSPIVVENLSVRNGPP